MADLNNTRDLGLYVHIPFCVKKCRYCDFLSAAADESTIEKYTLALVSEIENTAKLLKGNLKIHTMYIGGGTPSVLNISQLKRITAALWKVMDAASGNNKDNIEFTVEINPATADFEKLAAIKDMGVNRLSIGMQSTEDILLKRLGRIHSYDDFLQCYKMAGKAGFKNINVDIMSALPGQTPEDYEKSLNELIRLNPEHISSYSLIIEEGTEFGRIYGGDGKMAYKDKNYAELPGEDEERKMYDMTGRLLGEAGYKHYEISNYSKPGFESRHNSSYWKRVPYLGFGLGAASLLNKGYLKETDLYDGRAFQVRFENTRVLSEYLLADGKLKDIRRNINPLDKKACMEEFMFLGLRMMDGISVSDFYDNFDMAIDDVYAGVILKYMKMGLLRKSGERLMLTERGIAVSNAVLCDFLL
jgi:oxygen-independent coproporphyrinogen III oxidase